MTAWILLMAQAALAALGVRMMARLVLPSVTTFSQPALVLDVWGPLALVLPMLAFVRGMGFSVAHGGWPLVGGPAACAMLACGMAVICADSRDSKALAD